MKKKYYILVLTFISLFVGQNSYADDWYDANTNFDQATIDLLQDFEDLGGYINASDVNIDGNDYAWSIDLDEVTIYGNDSGAINLDEVIVIQDSYGISLTDAIEQYLWQHPDYNVYIEDYTDPVDDYCYYYPEDCYGEEPEDREKISNNGICSLKGEEGFKRNIYRVNGTGNPTIGYGHEILPGEDFSNGITLQKAEELLRNDIYKTQNLINQYVTVPLSQNQYDALVSYVFNTGSLYGTQLLQKLNAGDFAGAVEEMDINTSNGQYVQGLEDRRERERNMFENGIYEKCN